MQACTARFCTHGSHFLLWMGGNTHRIDQRAIYHPRRGAQWGSASSMPMDYIPRTARTWEHSLGSASSPVSYFTTPRPHASFETVVALRVKGGACTNPHQLFADSAVALRVGSGAHTTPISWSFCDAFDETISTAALLYYDGCPSNSKN